MKLILPSDSNPRRVEKAMVHAVRRASAIVRRHFGSRFLEVTEKTVPGDVVSSADLEVEATVADLLAREFPGIVVIGEESGSDRVKDEAFYLDPVDGTLNFVHGLTPFAVSLAYWKEGKPVVAVVGNPVTGDLFSAVLSCGARLNGRRILPSKVDSLRNSLVATGWPYDRRLRHVMLAEMDSVYMGCQELRTMGCASLGLCYVASGIFDGYWERGLKPWDMAAGVLIVTEAGGMVSSLTGAPFRLDDGECAASNGLIHRALIRTIGPSQRARASKAPSPRTGRGRS